MAGDWVKMRMDLNDEAEVIGIARRSGLDRDTVVGKLLRVWSWVSRLSHDGSVPHVCADDVDDVANRPGFADAMAFVGWLIVTDSGISLPHFDRHNSKSAKTRALANKRQQIHRIPVTVKSRLRNAKSVTREEKSIPLNPQVENQDSGAEIAREMADRRAQAGRDRAAAASDAEYERIRGGAKP